MFSNVLKTQMAKGNLPTRQFIHINLLLQISAHPGVIVTVFLKYQYINAYFFLSPSFLLSLVRPLNGNFPTISYLNLSELLALVPAGLHGGKKTPYCYSLPENGPPVSYQERPRE
jgi:hypothetical protein